ncbi:MAG: hypothetical protein SGILL_010464, partial [Bacillariaceae sp.]
FGDLEQDEAPAQPLRKETLHVPRTRGVVKRQSWDGIMSPPVKPTRRGSIFTEKSPVNAGPSAVEIPPLSAGQEWSDMIVP